MRQNRQDLALDAQIVLDVGIHAESSNIVRPSDIQPHQSICPYIGSTFDGFEEEFKYLHKEIFPKLNDLCVKRGVRFNPVDFRRSVAENRTFSDFTLKHALDSIIECSPFSMFIFGQRYGTYKEAGDLLLGMQSNNNFQSQHLTLHDRNLINAGKHGHAWVLERDNQICSMLELEIEAAALAKDNTAKYCFFYIRDFKHLYLKKTRCQNFDPILHSGSDVIKENEKDSAYFATDNFALFEAESKQSEEKLNNLKMKIVKKGWDIKFFSSPLELGQSVLENWSRVICQLYPTISVPITEFTDQVWCVQAMIDQLTKKYFWHKELEDLIESLNTHATSMHVEEISADDAPIMNTDDEAYIKAPKYGDGLFTTTKSFVQSVKELHHPTNVKSEENRNVFMLVGDPGSGKSALIAKWLQQFQTTYSDVLIISEFIGSSHTSRDIGSFLRRCLKDIRELHTNKIVTCSELLEDTKSYSSLVSAFQQSLALVPCIIVIDSLNDLKASMGEDIGSIKKLAWLPDIIPQNCCVILSTRRSDLTYKSIMERKDVVIKWMPSLQKDYKIKAFEARLTRPVTSLQFGRQNKDKIMGNRLSEKPLFIATLADLVDSCYNHQDIDQMIDKCTDLRTSREFWRTVFNIWTRRFSWTKGSAGQAGSLRTRSTASGWVADVLRLIASTRNGLLPSEILHLLSLLGYRGRSSVTPYDWMIFQKAARSAFAVRPEGYVTFAHTEVRHAIKYYLLGAILPTATGSAASLGQLNLLQHSHSLLSSYFLKYGSLKRKLIELPWQLEEGGDWIMLSQILTKPRFFQSICRASQMQPYLHVDLVRCWRKLNDVGYHPTYNLEAMIEKCTQSHESDSFSRRASSFAHGTPNWRSGVRFGSIGRRASSIVSSASPLKRPSMIIVTLHDDFRRQSTIGSRSETGDPDMMSEAGSCSFFITETESELSHAGWTASEDDPEQTIDESAMSSDESAELSYEIYLFLEQLGESFLQDSKDGMFQLYQGLLERKPLSTKQQIVQFKTLCSLSRMHEDDENKEFVHCFSEEALILHDSLSLYLVPLSFPQRMLLLELQASVCLCAAEMCMVKAEYDKAEDLLKSSVIASQECGSSTLHCSVMFICAKLFVAQGLYSHAESLFKRVFTERLQWFGPRHLSVANVLCELGDLYALTSSHHQLNNQRISLLAYKQALNIFQHNEDKVEEASILHKIGILLKEERSLCAIKEAKECFEHAMDTYMTQFGSSHPDIPDIYKVLKNLSVDLQKGQYKYGASKPPDTRTEERPYSAMSWHDKELKKMLGKRPCTAPSYLNKNIESARSTSLQKYAASVAGSRPYSSYSTSSHAKRIVVTPKERSNRMVSSATWRLIKNVTAMILPDQERDINSQHLKTSRSQITESSSRIDQHTAKSNVAVYSERLDEQDEMSELDEQTVEFRRERNEENKEIPVIIIPAGRQSRLSVKLEIDDSHSVKSNLVKAGVSKFSTASDKFSLNTSPDGRTMSTRSALENRYTTHRKHCHIPRGPDGISLTVHGTHSSIHAVLSPPDSPRRNVKSSGLCHKSAWYNVPGRYTIPGKVLPSKHKQVRPESAVTEQSRKAWSAGDMQRLRSSIRM